jgi:hypothetical protein
VSYGSIEELRSQLGDGEAKPKQFDPAYTAKQLHKIPESKVVVRNDFIVERVKGKNVLDFGASGLLHKQIVGSAAWVAGVDLEDSDGIVGFNLDDVSRIDLPIEPRHHRLWRDSRTPLKPWMVPQ